VIVRGWAHAVLAAWVVVALGSCGGKNPDGPTPPDDTPAVTSIAPPNGTTLGGTAVTIVGRNFAAGATVTVGGVAATNVQVTSPTTITAQTGQHAVGVADVIVTVGGRAASLPGAYTFVIPSGGPLNAPPTITGISSRSSRPNVPSRFADLDETITVTATVIDPETPSDQLKYEWTAESGTISGTGREISWRAPAQASTPTTSRLSLTVIETYQTVDAQGLPKTDENRATSTFDVRVHASAKEVRDMAVDFLVEFSQQRLSPQQIIRNFSDSCAGKSDELHDVTDNQMTKTINTYSVEPNPRVDVAFGGVCRDRGRVGDACAYVPVRWQSTIKLDGKPQLAVGTDQVSAIYENNRWRLCDSDFIGTTTLDGKPSLTPFKK
jgi:hypothetical protein